ncbi:MAG TPA: VanZ family protein [Synergistales bacterium]|jgi:VanZ family protein|nr:VanZ family protein [Synergistales bacterium]HRV71951.1 VanZ family protein [Thermovirgaceae bacterium]
MLRIIPIRVSRIIWTSGIAAFLLISVIPLGRTPLQDVSGGDKIAHFAVFFLLAIFPILTGAARTRTVTIILLLLAFGSEALQCLTSYRSGEIGDIAADISGLAVGILSGIALTGKKPPQEPTL